MALKCDSLEHTNRYFGIDLQSFRKCAIAMLWFISQGGFSSPKIQA